METDLYHIERVLKGETNAFRHLVERYQNFVFTIANRILKNREESEEVAQDVFVKAFNRLASYRKESKFSTWLYRITYNTAIDYTRRRKYDTDSLDREDAHFNVEDNFSKGQLEQLAGQQQRQFLEQAIKQLPQEDGLVISLFYLYEKSVEEVAEATGLSQSNVKVKLFRIRKRLKNILVTLLNNEAKELL